MKEPDNLKRLEKVFDAIDSDKITHQEFEVSLEAFLNVIRELKAHYETQLFTQISDTKSEAANSIKDLSYSLNELELSVKDLINSSERTSLSKIKELSHRITSEIDRVEQSIPNQIDLSPLERRISDLERKESPAPVVLDNPQQLGDKINTLHEVIKPTAIAGWAELERKINTTAGLPRDFDVRIGVSKTEIKRLTDRVIALETVGAGARIETPSGTVDASNLTYNVLNRPVYLVSDDLTRFEGIHYTYSGGTITMDATIPPVSYIRSIY
jgi:hypothetical protein